MAVRVGGHSGRYAPPSFAPITHGMNTLGAGLAAGLQGFADRRRQEEAQAAQQQAFGNILGAAGGGNQALAQALAQNPAIMDVPNAPSLIGLAQQLAAEPQAPGGDPFTLSPGQTRFDAAGNILAAAPAAPPKPGERRIIKGADGFNYYADTGERVLPGVEAQPERNPGVIGEYEAGIAAGVIPAEMSFTDYLASKRAQTNVTVKTEDLGKLEGGYRWVRDAQGNVIGSEPIPGGGKDPAKADITEAQQRVTDAAVRVGMQMDVLREPLEDGTTTFETLAGIGEHMAAKIPLFGNYMLTPEYQKAQQSMRDIGSALLRMETGAAAPEFERVEIVARYSPRPGDTPEVVQQKWDALVQRWRAAEEIAGEKFKARFEAKAPGMDEPYPLHQTAPTAAPAAQPDTELGAWIGAMQGLSNEEFDRQAQTMLGNMANYTEEEWAAMEAEWDRRYGGAQ